MFNTLYAERMTRVGSYARGIFGKAVIARLKVHYLLVRFIFICVLQASTLLLAGSSSI